MNLKQTAALIASALLLGACGSTSPLANLPATQAPQISRGVSAALGLYELQISTTAGGAPTATVTRVGGGALSPQELAGLSFSAAAAASYTSGSDKHLTVVVTVKNNGGAVINKPTFVPVALSNITQNGTFFRVAQDSTGQSTDPSGIVIEQAVAGSAVVLRDSDATPLISPIGTSALTFDVPAGSSVTRISDNGWQSAALAAGGSQQTTFGLNVGANKTYRLNMVFGVFDSPPLSVSSGVVFSEYIDGPGNDKAIEIYNGSNQTALANTLKVEQSPDGTGSFPLSYLIPKDLVPGATFVIANASASSALKARANATSDVANFNGNDALTLTASSTLVDSLGQVGNDPGANGWTGGSVSTKGQTLRRKLSVTQGDTVTSDTFDPSSQWDSLANTNYGGLGYRTDPNAASTTASLSGFIFDDLNKNAVKDSGEPTLKDWTVYLDSNGNGSQDTGEPSVQTAADGSFQFTGVQTGTAKIGVKNRLGYAGGQAVAGTTAGMVNLKPQIINGTEAMATTAPFQANVEVSDPDPKQTATGRCGGSVIAPRWILTAAHCFVMKDPTKNATPALVKVRVGVLDLDTNSDIPLEVEQIINHESYTANGAANDIALLKLKTPVPSSIVPIIPAMASETSFNMAGSAARVSGWGKTEKGDTSQKLLYVNQQLSDDQKCKSAWLNPPAGDSPSDITSDMICAETPANDTVIRESCQGDSGGPLFTVSGPLRQIGVVSFGSGSCQVRSLPGVYARLTYFDNWLSTNTGRGTTDTSITVNLTGDKSGVAIGVRQSN